MPSVTPLAVLYAAIPVSGLFISLFTLEQLVNGWLHGFASKVLEPTGAWGGAQQIAEDFSGADAATPDGTPPTPRDSTD